MDLVQNAGYELLPAAPSSGTAIAGAGTANTWSSWVQLTASLANDSCLMGIAVTEQKVTGGPTYMDFQIGVGASGSESPVSTIPVACGIDTNLAAGIQTVAMLPIPVFLTAGSRISARVGDDVTAARSHKLVLILAQAANILCEGCA